MALRGLVIAGSVSLARVCRAPWVGPLIAVWFLYDAWNKDTLVEIWGALVMIAAITAWTQNLVVPFTMALSAGGLTRVVSVRLNDRSAAGESA